MSSMDFQCSPSSNSGILGETGASFALQKSSLASSTFPSSFLQPGATNDVLKIEKKVHVSSTASISSCLNLHIMSLWTIFFCIHTYAMRKYLDLAPACDLAFLSGDGNGKSWKFHGESIELFMTSYSSPAGITVGQGQRNPAPWMVESRFQNHGING